MPLVTDGQVRERKKLYKNLGKHEDMRRRRTEGSVELRKAKKDDQLMKRRNVTAADEQGEQSETGTETPPDTYYSLDKAVATLSARPSLADMRLAFQSIRRLLSKSTDPPVQDIINAGLLKALAQAIAFSDDKVQFEAAWALTNIVSGTAEHTYLAVDEGIIPSLVKLCYSSNLSVAEQTTWALANISGDCAKLRDAVLESGFDDALLFRAKREDLTVGFGRLLAWSFSNLCRHKNPNVRLDVLRKIAAGIYITLTSEDETMVQDSCWAVCYMTDGPDEQMQLVLDSGFLPRILQLVASKQFNLVTPLLRSLGNLVTGSDWLTQKVVNTGLLKTHIGMVIENALNNSKMNIVKECCWFISNIIAGTSEQIQAVIDAGLLKYIVRVLQMGDFKSQMEACWAVVNLAQGGTSEQIVSLINIDVISPLCKLVSVVNNDMLVNMMQSLQSMLAVAAETSVQYLDKVKIDIEEAGGLDAVESLQNHKSDIIYELAFSIINTYFSDEDDEGKENTAPEVSMNMDTVFAPKSGFNL